VGKNQRSSEESGMELHLFLHKGAVI